MEYIREHAESFTLEVSEKMIKNGSFYHLNKPIDMHLGDQIESNQSCMGNGGLIVTPSFANFFYCSLNPLDHIKLRKGKGEDGGHGKSLSSIF